MRPGTKWFAEQFAATAAWFLLALASLPLAAQVTQTVAEPSKREEAFAELAQDVESLDAQLGIFKRVVRLVSPSVVHIEAKKGTRRTHEEAGSGGASC